MKKLCGRCKIEKETKDFTKDTRSKDGLHGYCKNCKHLYQRKSDKEYQRNKRATQKGYKAEEYREYKRKYPEKVKAQQLLNRNLRAGKIKRSPCKKCGTRKKIHAHHPDYSEPLKVIWLCPIHHKEAHAV